MLMRSYKDAVLIPVPYFPLYRVMATLHNGTAVPYFLDENSNWSINPKSINKNIANAKKNGLEIRAIVIINPNNPTGTLL